MYFFFFFFFFFLFSLHSLRLFYIVLSVNLGQPALMAFGLSGSLSAACFMYIFALLCVSTEWQIKMLACLLAKTIQFISSGK